MLKVRCPRRAQTCAKTLPELGPDPHVSRVQVLRAYARFVDDLKHDPWGAAKHYRCGSQ